MIEHLWNAFPVALMTGDALRFITGSGWTFAVISLIFLFLYYFFNISEMAIISLDDESLEEEAEQGSARAAWLEKFLRVPGHFLAICRFGSALNLFFFGFFLLNFIARKLFTLDLPVGLILFLTILIGLLIILLVQVLADKVPRRMAQHHPERTVQWIFPLFFLLANLLRLPVKFGSRLTNSLLKMRGIDPNKSERIVTEEELRMMLDASKESGHIPDDEKTLIENVFEFDDKSVGDVMTHRMDMFAVDIETPFDELVEQVIDEKYTRVPVYEEDIDHITGILHVRDLLYYAYANPEKSKNLDLRTIMRAATFTPESKNTATLFREMQRDHIHLMIVIDEYGGTAGLITIEDLLEEIVGQIQDEYDEEEPEIMRLSESRWLVRGTVTPEELGEAVGLELPEEEYETVAGMVIDLLDRIPEPMEHPTVAWRNLDFQVRRMDERRIDLLDVTLTEREPEEEDDE